MVWIPTLPLPFALSLVVALPPFHHHHLFLLPNLLLPLPHELNFHLFHLLQNPLFHQLHLPQNLLYLNHLNLNPLNLNLNLNLLLFLHHLHHLHHHLSMFRMFHLGPLLELLNG